MINITNYDYLSKHSKIKYIVRMGYSKPLCLLGAEARGSGKSGEGGGIKF